jgi:hypothetical protein
MGDRQLLAIRELTDLGDGCFRRGETRFAMRGPHTHVQLRQPPRSSPCPLPPPSPITGRLVAHDNLFFSFAGERGGAPFFCRSVRKTKISLPAPSSPSNTPHTQYCNHPSQAGCPPLRDDTTVSEPAQRNSTFWTSVRQCRPFTAPNSPKVCLFRGLNPSMTAAWPRFRSPLLTLKASKLWASRDAPPTRCFVTTDPHHTRTPCPH